MEIFIIPGFIGHPGEVTFKELEKELSKLGHNVHKVAWPNFPDNLDRYNFTNTIEAADKEIQKVLDKEIAILGFSMGGVIATYLAHKNNPKKLGLIVSPYQAGSDDDLQGKYQDWMKIGYRDLTSSIFGDLRIPFSFIEDARKYNSLDIISKIECPILFVVGENDEKIKRSASEALYKKATEPKTWKLIPKMEHRYQYQTDILPIVNETIIDFIQES